MPFKALTCIWRVKVYKWGIIKYKREGNFSYMLFRNDKNFFMSDEEKFFGESKKKVQEYIQQRLLLFKLQSIEKMSMLISVLFSVIVIMLFGFFIVLFISIMAGYYFASLTGSLYAGFGIVAGFYILLLTAILFLKKKVLDKFIVKSLMDIFFDKTNEDAKGENDG